MIYRDFLNGYEVVFATVLHLILLNVSVYLSDSDAFFPYYVF